MVSSDDGRRKTAFITGGAGGMGRAIGERLGEDGFQVVLADIDGAAAVDAADALCKKGWPAVGVTLDVTSSQSVRAAVDGVVERFGTLDVLVNNAGILRLAPVQDLGEETWDAVLNVNLRGAYLCARASLSHICEGGWGRIVNIASDAGQRGELYAAHYCASKFGLIGLTQVLALELAGAGVTVNAVCPTITTTPMMDEFVGTMSRLTGQGHSAVRTRLIDDIPVARPTAPSDIAHAVSFLCSEKSAFVTGHALNVTGGAWLG